ncbi:MAG TPA: rRNA adenine N-6-methyltransferase family protein, partial [Phototrophicaceae bacterium]|nr:rRNA adenine N-6-methyltransferase family protein [Phototrophicaceae bacterium]
MKPDPILPQKPSHSDDLRFTQNFLHSKALVDKIVKLAKLQPGSTVLEIGPGKGIITAKLADQVTATGKVIAIELDSGLANTSRDLFKTV